MAATDSPTAVAVEAPNPEWLLRLGGAYEDRKKNVVVLTGNVSDRQWSKTLGQFVTLEQSLYQACQKRGLLLVRFDVSNGFTFLLDDDERKFVELVVRGTSGDGKKKGLTADGVRELLSSTRGYSMAALTFLQQAARAIAGVARVDKSSPRLCVVVHYAGAIFPARDFDSLGEDDRQKLVSFLAWASAPAMAEENHLVILEADTRAEINSRILALPSTEHIEVELPSDEERGRFVRQLLATWKAQRVEVKFDDGNSVETFIEETAGIPLVKVEDMLEEAAGSGKPLTRKMVADQLNVILTAELGDIVKIQRPPQGIKDVIGQETAVGRLLKAFRWCDDPKKAIPAIIVPGPNGVGKTFTVGACANETGRVLVVLSGVRDKWFGETDRRFEKLLLVLRRFKGVVLYWEEARATLGSVHQNDVHETERRLTGYIIKLMSDKAYLGRVVSVLDTARPDGLDPDFKRRAPIMIPIFDPEEDARKTFVRTLLERNGGSVTDEELGQILERTKKYSSSDFDNMIRLARAEEVPPLKFLDQWNAADISLQRRFQALIAAQHCTYTDLIPPSIKALREQSTDGRDAVQDEIDSLRLILRL